MKKYIVFSITVIALLLFSNGSFSQTLELGTLDPFEIYTGSGAVTNDGDVTGDAGTNFGIISGVGFGPGYTGETYSTGALTYQARIDLLRVYIHLSDVFVTQPGTHASAYGGGETLFPGVYSIDGAGSISGSITLHGGGNPDAFFIMKFDGALTAGVGSEIILAGGTRAANVFWIAEGAISVGENSDLAGSFISHPGAVSVGLNCTIEGRLFSSEGAITVGAGTVAVMPEGESTIPIKCLGFCSPNPALDVLRRLKNYALFASDGDVSNAATSGIVGDIGTNNGAITGFATSTHVGDFYPAGNEAANAALDLDSAYNDLIAIPNTELGHVAAFGSGETLHPGVYFINGAGSLAGTLTLDGLNSPDAVFVFKFNGAFSVTAQSKVILINGASRCNVFWISEGATSIGTFTYMKGTVLAHDGACTMGANGNLEGRLLSTAGAVGFSTGVIYNNTLCFEENPPVAVNDINGTLVDTPVEGDVITNDYDPNGDNISVTLLTDPPNGTVVLDSVGTYTYTPGSGFEGEDVFTYVLCDTSDPPLCDTAEVSIEVTPITTGNEPPIAQDDDAVTYMDVTVFGNVLANDDDPDGDNIILNLTPLTGPDNGSITLLGDGTFMYTPDSGFIGEDVFTYSVCDDVVPSLCDTATVTITVLFDINEDDNDPPFAGDDFALTPQEVVVSGDLLLNDYDINGDPITLDTIPISDPSNGTVSILANGTYTYTPDPGFIGTDQFVYEICDDGSPNLCAQTTCYITVYPDNNPPVVVNDFNNTLANTPVSGTVITNDSDPDGDNLTVNPVPVSGPINGTLSLLPNGDYTYTPNPGFEGEDVFTYSVCDDGTPQMCGTADVRITVIPASDDNDPPVANPDNYVTYEGVAVSGNITSNDDDPDGDNIILNTNPITVPSNGSVTVAANGDIVYTPDPGFLGVDVFTYSICDDGSPVLCDVTTVKIIVLRDPNGSNNDPPFAGDDAALTPMNAPVTDNLLLNDYDPNLGDVIAVDVNPISAPSNGTVTIDGSGNYTYTPNNGYVGPDQFVYEICDDGTPSLCAQATCYITVYAGPEIDFTITEPLCSGDANGAIDITVTNAALPLTFIWSSGATTEGLNDVPAGTYVVTLTDAEGSVVQETIELTEPLALGVTVDVTDETTVNGCDGSAAATPAGGTAPFTFIWDDPVGQTTQTATGLCAGIYQVTVTDANGCVVTTSNVINPPSCDLDVNVTGQSVDCNGGAGGSVLATPITVQNNTPFTFLWNDGATIQENTGVTAGPYSVTVTDAIGCTASGSFVVTDPPLLTASIVVVDEQNLGGCDGSATATASGGTLPHIIEWSDAQIGATASNLCPGIYTVTITDANGCVSSETITVNQLLCSGFSVAVNTYSLSCFEANDGAAVAVVSGGTAPFTYFWPTGGSTADSISGLGAGSYTVIVTDDVACQQTVSGTVTQPAMLEAATAVDPVTCHGLANGTIELTVTGGTTDYTYDWSNGATTEDLVNLGPGTYGVLIEDANGCTATASGAVTESDTLGASSIDVDVTCFEGSDGSIDLTPTGGLAPYTYSWSTGATSEDVSGLSAGSYTVTFVDQNACVFEYSTTIDDGLEFIPTITAGGLTTFCDGDSVVLSAAPGNTYLWSTGETTESITVYTSGVYTVNMITNDGCEGDSDPTSVTVNANPIPTISPVGLTTFCDGGSVTLTTESFVSYLWSTGETTQSITASTGGSYTVSVTDGNSCEGTSAPITITVDNLPQPTVFASGDIAFCNGSGVTLLSSTANAYLWNNGQTTQAINVTDSGSFWVQVTDVNGCQSTSDTIVTAVFPTPTPTITAGGPTVVCDGDSVVLTSSVADAYLWSSGETTPSITVFAAGTFTVTVTDTNSCVGTSAPLAVVINQLPISFIFATGSTEFCEGDSVDLEARESDSYLWTNGDTTRIITVMTSGTYSVLTTDANGCIQTSNEIVVTVYQNPMVDITSDGPLVFCEGEDVVLTASLGAPLVISYAWSTSESTQSIAVADSGSYYVTVVDTNGCMGVSDTIDVDTWDLPSPIVTTVGTPSFCVGDTIFLTTTEEFESYLWTTGDTTQNTFAVQAGFYTVEVTDTNGCMATSPESLITVNANPDPTTTPDGLVDICLSDTITIISVEAASYLWTTGDTTQSILVWQAGTYNVTATDSSGCVGTSSDVIVSVNPLPNPTIIGDTLDVCLGGTVDLSTALAYETYSWSTGAISQSITVTESGTYTVTVTDSLGCAAVSAQADVTVHQPPTLTVTASGPTQFCDGDSVALTASAASSYDWSTGETSQSITVFTGGAYTVTVVDLNGCEATSAPINIEVLTNPIPTITLSGSAEICDGDSVVLTASGADGYLWSTGDTTMSITVMTSGDYSVEVTNQSGCSGESADVTITLYDSPQVEITATDTVACDGEIVTLTSSLADAYLWSTSANSQSIAVTQNGIYTVTVTDVNGCTASDDIEITVNPTPTPLPIITPDGPTTFCDGDSVALGVDPWESYLWSPNGDTTQTIVVDESGLYIVTVTNEFGCAADAAGVVVTVNELPEPVIQTNGDSTICQGETIELSTGLFNSYSWSTGDTTQVISVDTTGTYNVTVTDGNGCSGTSEGYEVIANAVPDISIEADGPTTICEGSEVVLSAIGNGPYLWSTSDTTQSITVSVAGTYFVQAIDTITGCAGVSDNLVIDYFPDFNPEITADGATAFCEGGTVVLTVVEGESFLWSTLDTTQSITVTDSAVYTVTVVDINGCTGVADQTVTVLSSEPTDIIADTSFPYCDGDTVTLAALGVDGIDSFDWSPNGDTTQSIQVTESDVYTVDVTSPFGCISSASLLVVFLPTPTAEVTIDGLSSICDGDNVVLTAIGIAFGNDYLWSNGETTPSITVSTPGTYSVTVTNLAGCSTSSEPVVIEVAPSPEAGITVLPDTAVCVGDTLYFEATGSDNYLWSNGETTASIVVIATEDMTYSVEATNDGCNQIATDEVSIIVQEYPTAAFGYGETNLGEPVLFTDSSTVPPLFSWDWDFGDGNTSNDQNPSNDYEEPGEYEVVLTVSTSAGCTDDTIQVLPVEEFFIITNVLTPNGDDINDHVWITSSLAEVIEAKIYNRWGLSVWEGIGNDLRFSGKTSAGADLAAGTYYYVISLNYGDAGVKELTGYITLIRE